MACGVICWDISLGHREIEFRLGVGNFKPGRSRWPGNQMTNNCLSTTLIAAIYLREIIVGCVRYYYIGLVLFWQAD